MTAAELAAFIGDVRAEAEQALARLAALDPDAISSELRADYDQVKAGWEQLQAITEAEIVELHEAACLEAGRELTLGELRGWVFRQ